jgi:ubiquinone/menaquinone biosynthesis C-methylase UbiE
MTEGELRDLTFSHRAARLVMAGVATGAFEALADTPRTADEVAAACGLAPRGARALLEALLALGLLERCGAAFVAAPEAKRVFTEKGERSRRHTVLHDLWHTGLWTRLEESLASGVPLADRSDDLFFTRPDVLGRFFPNLARAMAETSRDDARELAAKLALPAHARVLDLGGGLGNFADAIVARHPDAEVELFDQPPVIAEAMRQVDPRVELCPGDFLRDPLDPTGRGFHRVILSRVLMGLDDVRAVELLRRVREILRPNGVVDVLELRRGDGAAGRVAALLDVDMLLLTGGAVRRAEELRALLAAARLHPEAERSLGRFLLRIEASP